MGFGAKLAEVIENNSGWIGRKYDDEAEETNRLEDFVYKDV